MLKSIALLAIPGALGGVGLLFGPDTAPSPPSSHLSAYAVEVGVAFDEAAVRAALPDGLEPALGFTGGVAVYGGEEGWALSPLTTGHVWIDVVEEGSGVAARYMLTGFASERPDGGTPIPTDVAALGETHELSDDGDLHVQAWPDRATTLELVVRPKAADCADHVMGGSGRLLTSGPGGSLGVIHMPAALDWCAVEAEAGWVSVTAPFGHVLRPFVPQQVLWAQLATPL
jgi:hypothetical protein